MNNALKWGLILAAIVTVINLVFLVSGLHVNPIFSFIVILLFAVINIAVIVFSLIKSRAEKGYGGQLVQSLLIGLIGGVCIFVASYVILSFIFPNSISEMQEGAIAMLESAGLAEEQLEASIAQIEAKTATGEAITGMAGTFFTSLIVGAIAAIFLRKK